MPDLNLDSETTNIAKPFKSGGMNRIVLFALIGSLILGSATGYILATKKSGGTASKLIEATTQQPKTASQDTKTFKDFAEGVIKIKPKSKSASDYSEGTHILERTDNSTPVTLTSSAVDLSQYEGKKVKVYGETQKALQSGWLMDVGRVEEIK